jgi:hypothetical protein
MGASTARLRRKQPLEQIVEGRQNFVLLDVQLVLSIVREDGESDE